MITLSFRRNYCKFTYRREHDLTYTKQNPSSYCAEKREIMGDSKVFRLQQSEEWNYIN